MKQPLKGFGLFLIIIGVVGMVASVGFLPITVIGFLTLLIGFYFWRHRSSDNY